MTGINRDAISTRLVVGEREEYARQRATLHTGTPILGRTLARVASGADGDHIPLSVKAGDFVAFSRTSVKTSVLLFWSALEEGRVDVAVD